MYSTICIFINYLTVQVQNAPPLNQAPVYSQGPPLTQSPVYLQGPPPAPPVQQIIVPPTPSSYGRDPMTMRCPHCQQQIQTSIKTKPGPVGKCLLT